MRRVAKITLLARLGLTFACDALASNTDAPAASPVHPQLPIERHLTLTPGPGNPRNSEGGFIQLKDGRWLFVYTHFTGGAGDHAKAFLASRESVDGGRTWSGEDRMVIANEGGFNVMSVSLVRLKTDEIALFYLRKNSLADCRPVARFSKDEGDTWSAPVECITNDIGYYVLNNSRVIQLADGHLLMPTAFHGSDGKKLEPGKVVVFLSDDFGRTWRCSKDALDKDANGTRQNFMEPGAVETNPNHLLMVIRTKLGCQYQSDSTDGGETWSVPCPSELLSPEAPATLARIPATGDLLVVWDDHCNQSQAYRQMHPPTRTPLAAAISRDGGKTWQNHKLIEAASGHGYCYTTVEFTDDRVLLGYCSHSSAYGLETTQISSFPVVELYR